MSEVPITFLMRPKTPEGRDPGGRGKPLPSPPGRVFFIFLIVLTLIANVAVVLFFLEFTRQRLLDYQLPGPGGPDRTYSWMRDEFFTVIFFAISWILLCVVGVPAATHILLDRHIKGKKVRRAILWILMLFVVLLWGEARLHLPAFVVFLVASSFLLVRSPKRPLHRLEWLGLAYLLTLFVVAVSAGSIRYRIGRAVADSYDRAIEQGNTIIQALAEYNEDHGEYPEELEELVPDHLPEIPSTGMAGSPGFAYYRDKDVSEHYVLAIHLPSDQSGLNWHDLWYWPEQDYDNPDKPKVYNLLSRHRMDGWLYTYGGT